MHQAGIPKDIVQLAPGSGRVVGGTLTAHPLLSGVVFTGSTETARMINRTLAERDGPIIPFVAETGGQNAMIVDSSALPEQVTRDVISSAFQSAGQRCSALRVLFVQEDVADGMIEMIAGAMEALKVGDPSDLATDVGPVIDEAAKKVLDDHLKWLDKNAKKICRLKAPKEAANGCFVAPAFYEIQSLSQLNQENFGAILHVIRFAGDKLDKVVDDINTTGYGLTLGLQSRIDTVRDYVEQHARVGNFYVNRNQIGAVVESQPFGGEGLSGTGPKAGGPHYVARFATERVTCIDTTAAGGNADSDGRDRRLILCPFAGRRETPERTAVVIERGGLPRHERASPERSGVSLAASYVWRSAGLDQAQDIAVRVLEPGGLHSPGLVDVAVGGQPLKLVMLEADALVLQFADLGLDVADIERQKRRLVGSCELGFVDAEFGVAALQHEDFAIFRAGRFSPSFSS